MESVLIDRYENHAGKEEIYTDWYWCPKCKKDFIIRSHCFCPKCGVELIWNDDIPELNKDSG